MTRLLVYPLFCFGIALIALGEPLPDVPADPAATSPLNVGSVLPAITVRTPEGEALDLGAAVREAPTIVVYYRGGWCPICTRHLSALGEVLPKLHALGYQVLAISADSPAVLAGRINEYPKTIRYLSDSTMIAARKLGIAFRLADDMVTLYKTKYSIDIERDSGQDHHILPVPAILVVDRKAVIRYAYSNPDYKVRLSADELLTAARTVAEAAEPVDE